jgi:hypothetical protein
MPVITAVNQTLLAFAPVFLGHICLVSPSRTTTIVKVEVADQKKGQPKKETVVNEKIDYQVAKNGALAYIVTVIFKITA